METPPDDKKAKVLHARIPEALEGELKTKAGRLGISVSNLVRNVLMNTFGLVDAVVTDSAEIASSARGGKARAGTPQPGAGEREIAGWQEVILNVNAICQRCNAILRKGTPAALGVSASPGPLVALCKPCLKKGVKDAPGRDRKTR